MLFQVIIFIVFEEKKNSQEQFLFYFIFFLAVQMSQSGQLTLELPYVIIGLGATPNFVEKITVAIPPNIRSVCSTINKTLIYMFS